MPRNNVSPVAAGMAAELQQAIYQLQDLPRKGVVAKPMVRGLTEQCTTAGNLENKLAEVAEILVASKRVFCYGNSVMLEVGRDANKRLVPLLLCGALEPHAAENLGNIVKFEVESKNQRKQFPPSAKIASNVLLAESTEAALPKVTLYARRPIYDRNFKLSTPGWDEQTGVLVHGQEVAVEVAGEPQHPEGTKAVDRLPTRLKALLGDFCFKTDADLANALGAMLTIPLMMHHVQTLHPVIVMDSNQPGSGKTIFARTIGMLMDGEESRPIPYTADESELRKAILSTICSSQSSCVIIDNAKRATGRVIDSPTLESAAVLPRVSMRILGQSTNFERPNDLFWFITMNEAKLSSDIVSRSLPIQLYLDGSPGERKFKQDPVEYAERYRNEILAELVAMIELWKQKSRPLADRPHRLRTWSGMIDGILEVNGFPEFLSNLESAASTQNSEVDELEALAEQCLLKFSKTDFCAFSKAAPDEESDATPLIISKGVTASKWEPVFKAAGVLQESLAARKSAGSLGKVIASFLAKFIGRSIVVCQGDKEGTATLRMVTGQGGKHYYFEFGGELANGPVDGPEAGTPSDTAGPGPCVVPLLTGPAVKSATTAIVTATSKSQPRLVRFNPGLKAG